MPKTKPTRFWRRLQKKSATKRWERLTALQRSSKMKAVRSGTIKKAPMTLEDVETVIKQQPFVAFRIHMTSGKSFVVTHPDQVMLSDYKAVLGVGGDKERRVVEHFEHLAFTHIAHLEEMPKKPKSKHQ